MASVPSIASTCKLTPLDPVPNEVAAFIEASIADNTRRAYRSDLAHLSAWGGTLPAEPALVASYLAAHAETLSVAIKAVKEHLAASGGTINSGSTTVQVKTFKFHEDQVKTVDAAIEKAKKSSHTPHDSVALEYICLDYMGGSTLQQRFAGLAPEAVAKTFVDVLNAFDKQTAETIVKSMMAEVTHDFDLIV